MKKKPLIVLTGPTAAGKSQLSIRLAKEINGEIISADSMQVYRYMDVGSAKITPEEMEGVPHFLVDEISPFDEFNVVVFQKKAKQYVKEIQERGHVPILVGGTGFYVQALLYDVDFTENRENEEIRRELTEYEREHGPEALHQMLREVDEASAREIHPNNVKRVLRAIEFYRLTGEPISRHNERERDKESPYQFVYFVLEEKRDVLYEKIDARVDQMLAQGLVEEVERLRKMGCTRSMVSMQGLGYKEMLEYLEGEISLDEAIYKIKRDTRHFAKRQMTWFRRERDVTYVRKWEFDGDNERLLLHMLGILRENGIVP